jgi:diguanylate cyclase (GGDEF)-like protein/PAS domain S-box-containing protein
MIRQSETTAQENENHYRIIVDSLQDAVFVLDAGGIVTDMNPSARKLLGVTKADVIGRPFSAGWEVCDAEGWPLPREGWPLSLALKTGLPQTAVLSVNRPGEARIWLNVSSVPLLAGPARAAGGVITTLSDITSLKEKEAELENSLYHDQLTDLPNRHRFFDLLNSVLSAAAPEGTRHGVLFIDLDGFKHINDLYGYRHGDELLKAVAGRLKQCVAEGETLARLGADEFAILLPHVDSVRYAARTAKTVLQRIAQPFVVGAAEMQVELTVSIGIAIAPTGSDQVTRVARQANNALQGAKLSGKARVVIYDEQLDARIRRREQLERDLLPGLARGEFSVHYQPIVGLADGLIRGTEALLRWEHTEFGPVMPDEFIPLAEVTGAIHPLGSWVIEESVKQLGSWLKRDPALQLSINLSPRQLEAKAFLAKLTRTLEQHGVPHSNVMLELTETYLMQNVERNARELRRFADLGISIAIDDFGTGYSSLKYLQYLPVSHLKIDRSFIEESVRDERGLVLLEAIIHIARKLSLTVIAEGVETSAQAEVLCQAGCSLAQGYLFAHALSRAGFGRLLDLQQP